MKKDIMITFVGLVACLLAAVSTGMAGVPQMINFQGRLTDSTGTPLDGEYSVRFRIYADSLAATVLWEESWLTTQDNPLRVSNGIFNVLLGSVNPVPDSVFTGSARWLGMKIEGDPEMRPLKEIASVGYAYHSNTSDTAEYSRSSSPDGDWVIDGDNIYFTLGGRVGIGTENPSTKLHVEGPGDLAVSMGDAISTRTDLYLRNDESGLGQIRFHDEDLGSSQGQINYDHSADKMAFVTSGLVRSVIDSTGNVGIGTVTPTTKLTVQHPDADADQVGLRLETDGPSGSGWADRMGKLLDLKFGRSDYHWQNYGAIGVEYTYPVSKMHFHSFYDYDQGGHTTNKIMTIQGDGNVGIGLTTPQRSLHIKDVLRLEPQASAPSGGLGDLYVGTDGKLYFHNGSEWKEVALVP